MKRFFKSYPGAKTLKQLIDENGGKTRFSVNTPTNGTPRYRVLGFSTSKNLAILLHRGTGWHFFRKYYDMFVLDNPRWFRE